MKDKAAIIGIVIVALGLGAALFVVSHNARKQQQDAQARLGSLSNEMVTVRGNFQEQQQVNLALSSNLAAMTATYSNKLSETEASLHAAQASLDKAQADAKAAADAATAEIAARDKKISDLEATNADLDKQSDQLHAAIANLETQIASTKEKLASSEGDRRFLLGELQRLVAEKADLEKKFNDVASLKTQLRKVRDELAQARRLDWMRRGLYALDKEKGGERLMRHEEIPASSSGVGVSLDVELHSNGPPKVLSETNTRPEAPAPGGTPR